MLRERFSAWDAPRKEMADLWCDVLCVLRTLCWGMSGTMRGKERMAAEAVEKVAA